MKEKITNRVYSSGNELLDRKIGELVDEFASGENIDIAREIIVTGFKLLNPQISRLDLKILNSSLKEVYKAFMMFSKYRGVKKVSVFGSARTKPENPNYKIAREFSSKIARLGYMIITGAGPGIMQAGNEGAGPDKSFGVSIRLPFEYEPNPHIAKDKVLKFKYFFARKLAFAKETNAIVLCHGGVGTLDEGFELLTLLQTGKSNPLPVVMLEPAGGTYWKKLDDFIKTEMLGEGLVSEEDLALYRIVYSADEAVEEVCNFYKNYHSLRFVGDLLSIRMQRKLPEAALAELNEKFLSIVVSGSIIQSKALAEEENETDLADMPRLVFNFNRRNYGKLRMLIDEINKY